MLMNLSCKTYSKVVSFFSDKRGVTAIEYAIIGVAMSAIILTVFNGDLGDALSGAIEKITTNISSVNTYTSSTN
ncbi:Flp family type IVb pilin [Vibrio sp. CAIM 722]|uniref:Flp family type IVb pilin n=1 Tax=Vibrio eleionomae TaxID=2653505 RepID=A0A7X4RX66_9VIBR|nr:Flp family type IVb pilin [Vibrio eleionomae]MZI96009.1 Flp family type IVb pilin [Vibrio eleionomae]